MSGRAAGARAATVGLWALVPAMLTVAAASLPGGDSGFAIAAALLWLGVAIAEISLLLARLIARTGDQRWWPWVIAPGVLAVTMGLALSGLPLAARFGLSKPYLERLPNLPLAYEDSTPAGLYQTCCFERTDFGYVIGVREDGLTTWGFAYSPGGPPPGRDIESFLGARLAEGESGYRHLDGSWYIWELRNT